MPQVEPKHDDVQPLDRCVQGTKGSPRGSAAEPPARGPHSTDNPQRLDEPAARPTRPGLQNPGDRHAARPRAKQAAPQADGQLNPETQQPPEPRDSTASNACLGSHPPSFPGHVALGWGAARAGEHTKTRTTQPNAHARELLAELLKSLGDTAEAAAIALIRQLPLLSKGRWLRGPPSKLPCHTSGHQLRPARDQQGLAACRRARRTG